uniref:Uncharacterized protein n=1 Tax=Arundo donax TaxID=35708 RepID=A0A0A9ESY7_ARUDO
MIVGTLDTRGIAGDASIWSSEFKPPSFALIFRRTFVRY